MLSRLGAVLLAMTVGFYAWADKYGFVLRTPLDLVVKAELSAAVKPGQLARLIEQAMSRDDVGEAQMYRDIATLIGAVIPTDMTGRLSEATTPEARMERAAAEFGAAFLTGTGESEAALAGAVSAESTITGDIRDITLEGAKLAAGQNCDEIVLGVSVVALAAAGKPDQKALNHVAGLWKVAYRSGLLTPEMQTALLRTLHDALSFDAIKMALAGKTFNAIEEAQKALAPVAQEVKFDAMRPFLTPSAEIMAKLGDAEAIKLIALAIDPPDLAQVAKLADALSGMTRGVIELTGKRRLDAFKTTTTLDAAFAANPSPFIAWGGVCLLMMALGQFKLFGPLPRARTQQRKLFHRMPVRQLNSFDGSPLND